MLLTVASGTIALATISGGTAALAQHQAQIVGRTEGYELFTYSLTRHMLAMTLVGLLTLTLAVSLTRSGSKLGAGLVLWTTAVTGALTARARGDAQVGPAR